MPRVRPAALTALTSFLILQLTIAQTSSKCNPLSQQCPPDPALGSTKNVDFTQGAASSDFSSTGPVSYDGSNGACFTIAKSGDNPTIMSNWYIMFGKVDITMQAATGTGIVSSLVMESDDLDEIDWEILGSQGTKVQTNYFGKGQTGSYDRGATSDDPTATSSFNTYTIDWTSDEIVWQLNGQTVRTLNQANAAGQYPQTPLKLKLGAWAGGDSSNAQGVVSWAGGSTDYSQGPFKMFIKSVTAQDYSTGKTYSYSGTDGTWTQVRADGGSVNGGSTQVSSAMSSSADTTTTSGQPVPWSGTHAEPSQSFTAPSVYPWVSGPQSSGSSSSSDGAAHPIMPASSATPTPVSGLSESSPAPASTGSSASSNASPSATAFPSAPFRAGGSTGPYNPPAGASNGFAAAPAGTSLSTVFSHTTPIKAGTGLPTPAPYKGAAAGRTPPALPALAAAFTGLSTGHSVLWIDPDVDITLSGGPSNNSAPSSYGFGAAGDSASAAIVETAINETRETLFNKNFVPWKFHPRNSDFEPQPGGTQIQTVTLTINDTSSATNISKPLDGQFDEGYSLQVTDDGKATIQAASAIGISWGLNTFSQLFYRHSNGGAYTSSAPVMISDSPVFPHRGLNLDVSRTYYDVQDIIRTIDALAFNKFNRLHVHITDAQSWPLVIPSHPELSDKGAYTTGQVYNPDQLQQMQQYGAARGVEVYLEIDMPGHTSAVAFSHPELVAAFNAQPDWDTYCAEPPCGTLKLNDSAVYTFLDSLFGDLLPRVAANNAYFHTGGDEVNFNAYSFDDSVGNTNDTKVLQPLLQNFFDYIHKNVTAAGLTHIVWEEMLLSYNLTLPPETVVQSWQSDEAVQQIVSKGLRAISGNYNYTQKYFPFNDYCSPLKNWRDVYSYDPLSGVAQEQSHLVLGGECSMWSEQSDGVSVDGIIWPRLAAAGEVLWSGAKDPATGQNRSQITAAPRLSEMRERLVARGVQAATIQMPFCTQNGTQCTQPD
ncbi:MAG: hypothetical protein Q9159_004689 [Coniocarpon cinnabarinum]